MKANGMVSTPPKRIRVLCVDDNWLLLDALHRAVTRNPSLEWVGGLERADTLIEAAKKLCPDIVILDLIMPGANAFEELKKLSTECPDARVLVFSSDSLPSTVKRTLQAGAWGFVSKYEPFAIMVEAIETVAAGRTYFGPFSRP